ncbi:MAG: ester cyclase [Nitrososphaeraceae archaeon]|nr:ester cyclase [Nitrososphaeraceae archaeon]
MQASRTIKAQFKKFINLFNIFWIIIIIPRSNIAYNVCGRHTSGEDEQATEENNIKLARQLIEAFNTGDVSNVSQFTSPQYFNHESQVDPVRGQLRGPEEFIDTIKNNHIAFLDLHYEEQAIITQDNIVVSIINVTGTNRGNFFIL